MKKVMILLFFLVLIGCSHNERSKVSTNDSLNTNLNETIEIGTIVETKAESSENPGTIDGSETVNQDSSDVNPSNSNSTLESHSNLSEDEALKLVNTKLNQEQIRISSIKIVGTDDKGNYIVKQSSKATTEVMEWYHVNLVTQEISCEILGGTCLDHNTPLVTDDKNELSLEQQQALELAKSFATNNLVQYGYVDKLTYVEFSHMANENFVFQIYNPGSGGTDTIDWLTVDLDQGSVVSKFKLDK
ncbi:hypothetical protein NYE25_06405 [Paenibacillus sp. FSL E2-8871]|uniref:hypothetical protein n=1 Tax=Paenibacillus sp. FSL E2-8871 TaxID=2975326 RepID=UPI0030F556E0